MHYNKIVHCVAQFNFLSMKTVLWCAQDVNLVNQPRLMIGGGWHYNTQYLLCFLLVHVQTRGAWRLLWDLLSHAELRIQISLILPTILFHLSTLRQTALRDEVVDTKPIHFNEQFHPQVVYINTSMDGATLCHTDFIYRVIREAKGLPLCRSTFLAALNARGPALPSELTAAIAKLS